MHNAEGLYLRWRGCKGPLLDTNEGHAGHHENQTPGGG